jgi:hypothetical protein
VDLQRAKDSLRARVTELESEVASREQEIRHKEEIIAELRLDVKRERESVTKRVDEARAAEQQEHTTLQHELDRLKSRKKQLKQHYQVELEKKTFMQS